MKNTFKRIFILSIVSVLSGLILAQVYNYATPKIAANQKETVEKAIFNLLPSAENYNLKKINNYNIYFCYDEDNKFIGYIFKAEGMGYQGKISIMVGLNKDLSVLEGIEVLEHSETPGLGAKITTKKFSRQFKDLKIYPSIEYVDSGEKKEDTQTQAITGATVTSKSKDLKNYPSIEYVGSEEKKEDNQIQAITGATVTSKSIVNILNNKLKEVIKILKDYNGE